MAIKIVIFGDYDVDGICSSAILWETIRDCGGLAVPYIPHRVEEGYGLSIKGIENVLSTITNTTLIITVDNGIVAFDAVDFANSKGIDVIVTDHHVIHAEKEQKLPNAFAIVHTTKLCGTGVAWILSQELKNVKELNENEENHLELVALATIADVVPLVGANRTLVTYGLQRLHETKRVGLLELFKEAAISAKDIGVYEIGHIIAPRLNAMGRMEYAMESLRLLCTNKKEAAEQLAQKLGRTNKERQDVTFESVVHAKQLVEERIKQGDKAKILFVAHEMYQQGVIGLIAGRLVESYYKPSIVLSIGETYSKASARSVTGFNIIEFIRMAAEHLVDAGGHPMAAGFTVETAKLSKLQQTLEELAEKILTEETLVRVLK